MNEQRDELLDETVLRRALRFEADERAPRFDAGAIALLARRDMTGWAAFAALCGTGIVAITAWSVWSTIFAAAPLLADAAMATIVDVAVGAATLLLPIATIAAQPAVPLSLLAALGVAILHELRERREHAHEDAS
jgi:hypothetical protein